MPIPAIPLDAPFRVQIPPRMMDVFDPLKNETKKVEVSEIVIRMVDASKLNPAAINSIEIFPGIYLYAGALP